MPILTNGTKILTNGTQILFTSDSYPAYPPSGVNEPTDLGSSLAAWYAPESALVQSSDQDRVIRLLDQSGNGRDSQLITDLSISPILLPNGSIRYQGSRNTGVYNAIDFTSGSPIQQPFTIIVRAKINGNAQAPLATDYLFDGYNANRTIWTISGNGTDDSEFAIGMVDSGLLFPLSIGRPVWAGIWRTYTMVADGANSRIYIDDTLVSTANFGAAPMNGLRLGAANVAAHGLNGQMPEILIASKALSPSEVTGLHGYLTRWKDSIPVTSSVVWTAGANASVLGDGTIRKNAGTGEGWNAAGGTAQNVPKPANGTTTTIRFPAVPAQYGPVVRGLNATDNAGVKDAIEFGLYNDLSNYYATYFGSPVGVLANDSNAVVFGDLEFRIKCNDYGVVSIQMWNDSAETMQHEFTQTPTFPLRIVAALWGDGTNFPYSRISGATIISGIPNA